MKINRLANKICTYIILLIGVFLILYPLYLTFITAFKTPVESSQNFFSFPTSFYLDNFKEVIGKSNYFSYVGNSLLITGVSGLLFITVLPMVSYSIARNMQNRKYYKFLYIVLIFGIFIPFQVKMVPIVQLMNSLNLMSRTGLIILYLTGSLCQGVFLLVGYIKTIPLELEESAIIDGSSTTGVFFRIIYPLIKPMTVTVLITSCLWVWNDFLMPLLILNRSATSWTLPLFQYNFKAEYSFDYNLAFASFTLALLPIMILFVFIQKHVINGLTGGAVKN